jgi:hypothetical protein
MERIKTHVQILETIGVFQTPKKKSSDGIVNVTHDWTNATLPR